MWFRTFVVVQRIARSPIFIAVMLVTIVALALIGSVSSQLSPLLLNTIIGTILLGLIVELITYLLPVIWRKGIINPYKRRAFELMKHIVSGLSNLDVDPNGLTEQVPDRYYQSVFHEQNVSAVEQLFSGRLPLPIKEAMNHLTPEEWALALIYFNKVKSVYRMLDDPQYGATSYKVKELGTIASKVPQYIQILLTLSLCRYFPKQAYQVAQETIDRSLGFIDAAYEREIGDERLRRRALGLVSQDEYFVVSTTSQVTNLSLDILGGLQGDVGEIYLFLVHPDILGSSALIELGHEYRVPQACIPPNQFLEDNGDFTVDYLRRMLRILTGVREVIRHADENPNVNFNVYFFTKVHPNIRIRLATKRQYLQIYPGSLGMVRRLYRFGIDSIDGKIIYQYLNVLRAQIAGQSKYSPVEKFNVSQASYEALETQALRSMFKYLFTQGVDKQRLEQLHSALFQLIPAGKDNKRIFQDLLNLYDQTLAYIDTLLFEEVEQAKQNPRNTY